MAQMTGKQYKESRPAVFCLLNEQSSEPYHIRVALRPIAITASCMGVVPFN